MAYKLFFLCLCCYVNIFGQGSYLIYFKDKGELPSDSIIESYYTLEAQIRREKHNITYDLLDVPISKKHLKTLQNHGHIKGCSRWLNAVLMNKVCDLDEVSQLEFVKKIVFLPHASSTEHRSVTSKNDLDYGANGTAYELLDIPFMHQLQYRGQGVKIAIFDSGFKDANTLEVFTTTSILWTHDFVDEEENVYNDDVHGVYVLSILAANKPGTLIGTAYASDFYLFRTEDEASETREEEFNWLMAAEKADSLGVDIIASSLGYNLFDNTSENYNYTDLDGKTTIITQAASIAAQKGILVVNSMGNEGDKPWNYMLAPADADSILSVGATDGQGEYQLFSSKGPTSDGRIKPDVVCQGIGVSVANATSGAVPANGTSYAAPQIAGLCSGILSVDSTLTNMEVIDLVRKSSSRYSSPDNKYGYGIPSFSLVLNQLLNGGGKGAFIRRSEVFPNPVSDQVLRLFLESDADINSVAKVELHHVHGGRVHVEEVQITKPITPLKIDVSTLASGLYILKVNLPSGEYVHKLMKL